MQYFSLSTIKLALQRVYMNSLYGDKTQLCEREYALASAKLIQQFQYLLKFVHENFMPAFEEAENESGFWSFVNGLLGMSKKFKILQDKNLLD